ncbi:MAG TPA: TetR/AcrR family transcriptional regulator [Candidatus Rifleibacterium sp.]|nr:TetR/AcrR family transcriptional regulator [Candidatus Rifleibacterium sp.]HPT44278.1 TetR/AcrR family transcriptional regulator [Candidatus Rifleibacterium sp.]
MPKKTGEQRKIEILAITRNIIFTEGFNNFSIRVVASQVGISEAAIYRHFESKEELILGLLDSLFVPWRLALEELIVLKVPCREKLRQLANLHIHHLIDRQLNPLLFFSEAIRPENSRMLEKLRTSLAFLRNTVVEIFTTAVATGELPGHLDVEATASCVVGLLQTTVIRWTMQQQEDGLVELAETLTDFFYQLLSAKGA